MSDEEKIQFKSIKRKNMRQRKKSSSDEEGETSKTNEDEGGDTKLEIIHELKEKQKLRNRSQGVNA
jgi:hypothetical protein